VFTIAICFQWLKGFLWQLKSLDVGTLLDQLTLVVVGHQAAAAALHSQTSSFLRLSYGYTE